MTPTTLAILVSAFVNALAVIAVNGLKAEIKAVRELLETKHDAMDARLEKVEEFKENFFQNKLTRGASQHD